MQKVFEEGDKERMSEEEETEEKLQTAIDLYEFDMIEWTADILLDELERMYSIREQINRIILAMKSAILKEVEK